ncbi:MAG: AAA family ATPase [Streptosporangiaceae bacterium]
MTALEDTRARIAARVVGRERGLELILAAVAAGRDLLLEGPPGTSKSTLLRAITAEWGVPLVFVEGNADLTTAKLIGHHNPAQVLREDYSADNFVDGPLLEAMHERRA